MIALGCATDHPPRVSELRLLPTFPPPFSFDQFLKLPMIHRNFLFA